MLAYDITIKLLKLFLPPNIIIHYENHYFIFHCSNDLHLC